MDLAEVREKMEKALRALAEEVAAVQAGRATPAMVERIMVEAYNTRMPLLELATISAPEPSQLLITPFDQTIIKSVEQAVTQHRELKLSALIEENAVRVQIPPLTAERRKEFLRLLNQKLETGKVEIRRIRQDYRADLKRAFENNELSEDAKFHLEKDLQEITDEFVGKIEEVGKKKEAELGAI